MTKGDLAGMAVALIEKAGHTSITQAAKQHRAGLKMSYQEAFDSQIPVVIFLRHPIERLVSAWRYFHPQMFPNGTHIPQHRPLSRFIDDVLSGVPNEHWNPQLARFAGCNISTVHRFENINEHWPDYPPLLHLNKSKIRHPGEIEHRRAELDEFYAEDLAAWLDAT